MKRIPVFLLLLALCIPPAHAAEQTSSFTDVPAGSWYEEGVNTCAEKGVMVGTGEGKFSPDTRLNTAECLTLALRLYDLQRGGDGTLEKAPEDWGKLTLTLNDGTVYEGYGEAYEPFGWSTGTGLSISCEDHGPTLWDQEVWGTARSGSATVTVDGRTIPGTMHLKMGYTDFFLDFIPDNVLDIGIIGNVYDMHAPSPGKWYRDALYTAYQLGLNDESSFPGFAALLEWGMSGLTFRKDFASALADAAGELEKKYTVETIYDVYNNETSSLSREENKGIYTLYEAGVLNGINEFGTLGGHEYLTRAQAAVMVARVLDESQRLGKAPAVPSGYDLAVSEMRARFGYMNERTFDTDECTIFIHDSGGMHSQYDIMTLIYKPGSKLGDGHTIGLPHARVQYLIYAYPADTMTLSGDGKTFTYTYYRPEDILGETAGADKGEVLEKAGQVTYTVDLPTGEVAETFSPLNYDGAMAHVKRKRAISSSVRSEDREVVDILESEACTAVLTKGRVADQYDDYILSLVYKPGSALGDGTVKRLMLPSTLYEHGYKPTDRAPDHMGFSGDGSKFIYSYRFLDRLAYTYSEQPEIVLHEAGTYVYTVDVATGELSVELPDPYEYALKEVFDTYQFQLDRQIETDACTIVTGMGMVAAATYDRAFIGLVYKDGSQPGAGTKIWLPTQGGTTRYDSTLPHALSVSEDGRTLTYSYRFEEPVYSWDGRLAQKAGSFTYTVDLLTGEYEMTYQEP